MGRNDYQVERASYAMGEVPLFRSDGHPDPRLRGPDVSIIYSKIGLCAANSENPFQPRDFQWNLDNVINPMVERGEIDDGSNSPFDDRKLRYEGSNIVPGYPAYMGDDLFVSFGITHYKAFLADQNRSDEDNLKLQERGQKLFGDRYAFFSRAPGIAVLPITKEGSVFVGERTNEEQGGFLNAVAGHLKYRNPEEVDIQEDLLRELEEEFGLTKSSLVEGPTFVGVYSHPIKGDLDFTYIVQTDVPNDYFSSGTWMEKVSEREHKPLIQLASMVDVQRLLQDGKVPDGREFPLMYSTRGALGSLREEDLIR